MHARCARYPKRRAEQQEASLALAHFDEWQLGHTATSVSRRSTRRQAAQRQERNRSIELSGLLLDRTLSDQHVPINAMA
jgi:hypothetical protein